MKELKKIFTEIGHTYKNVWSRKKHFIHITSVLLVLAVTPSILFLLANLLFTSGFVTSDAIGWIVYGVSLLIILVGITFAVGATGFVASIRSILAHKNEPLKKIFTKGTKKLLPSIGLGIVTVLPIVTLAAFAIYFKLGSWGLVLVIIGLVWLLLTSFSKLFLLLDDESVHASLHKGVIFFIQNTSDIVLRALASFVAIVLPVAVVVSVVEIIHTYIIKFMFAIPTFTQAVDVIENYPLPLSGVVVGLIFTIISLGISLYLLLPLIVTYYVKIFDDLKEKNKASKKVEKCVEKTAIAIYTLVVLLSLAILLKTIL
jgi:hypothetical protein